MGTGSDRISIRSLLGTCAAGLHIVVLLAVVAVPGYALVNAVRALLEVSEPGQQAALFDPQRWLVLLGNTVVVCGVALATATSLGLVLGLLVARTDLPGRTAIVGVAILGVCVPVYVGMVFIFSLIPLWRFGNSAWLCGLLYGLFYTPLAVVILAAAFRSADRDLEDQARLDADLPQILRHVTIPQAGWGIATLAVLVVLLVATDFTIADILMVRTFAEEVYTQYALLRSPAGPVLASLPVLVVMAVLLVAIQVRYRLLGEHSPWQFGARPRTIPLGRGRSVVAVCCIVVVLTCLGPPAVALLMRIESPSAFVTAVGGLQRELLVSGALAATGATIVACLGVGLAWAALRTGRFRWLIWVAIVLLLAVPAPVAGISLIELLNQPGWAGRLYDSPAIIALGYVVRFLPLGVLLLIPAVQRVPLEVESAARLDGCDWLAAQRHIYWPAIAADAAIVWLVIAVLCFAEVGCTVLLAPPGWTTASVRAFTLMHFGVYRDLAALALASVGCILFPWLLLVCLLKRRLMRNRIGSGPGSGRV
ncbi:MAG TPA: ABC transporter permease subunit [Phycisphaerae bacterium]|nr:ABC transporter permease subunit [Phycisphaerae bacterium]